MPDDLSHDDKIYMNLNQEQFDGWLADLRSGNFKQGRQHLKLRDRMSGDTRHCCLGVLGERLNLLEEDEAGDWMCPGDSGDEYLPFHIIEDTDQTYLAGKNDDDRWDFERIAEYIEKNYAPKL